MTNSELDNAALADLLADAESAEKQAAEGPFYPERGITADMLRTYASKCRAQIETWKAGGAHKGVLAAR